MLIQSIYSLLKNLASTLQCITASSKGHSIILSNRLLQDGGEHDKISKFHGHEPIAIILWLASQFLGNTVWNTKMVDKAFYKYMSSSFDKSIMCREDKSICRIIVYFSKDKLLPLA